MYSYCTKDSCLSPDNVCMGEGPTFRVYSLDPSLAIPCSRCCNAPAIGTHSRKPGILGQVVGIKYGVSVPRNTVGTKQGLAVTFVSIDDDSAPISSFPATAKTSSRLDPSPHKGDDRYPETFPRIWFIRTNSSHRERIISLCTTVQSSPTAAAISATRTTTTAPATLAIVAATLSRDKTMARVLRILHLSNVSHCLTVQVDDPRPNGPGKCQMNPGLSSPLLSHQHPQHHGQPPNMPPQQQQQQLMPVFGWPGHYYQQDPYMQQQQQQHMPPQFHPHLPPGPQGQPGMRMSPRNPQMPLQPGTPTQSTALTHQPPHSNNGSSSNIASPHRPLCPYALYSRVPEQQHPPWHPLRKPTQHAADGSEVDLKAISSKRTSPGLPGLPPSSPSTSGFNRTANGHRSGKSQSIRMESEEARKKRVAEEEAKADRERAVEEAEEKVKEDAEEKAQREEEARVAAIKKAAEDEEERIRKDEQERVRKEEEKERIGKEAEETGRVKAEEAERVQQAGGDKAREEAAAAQKAAEDAERAKEEEAIAAAGAVTAAAKEKEEGEVAESPSEHISDKRKSGLSINTAGPSQEARKPRPGPLDLSYGKTPITPGLPSVLATARIIEDIEKMESPEGIMSPKLELNVNAKDSKFKYDRDFLLQFMSICKEKPDQLLPLDAVGLEPVDQWVRRARAQALLALLAWASIITWANKSETEKDGRTLIQVIRLGFEKATDEAAWSEMTMASRTTRASPSKAKRQGLELIKFIGEWFKLQMPTERIMHECVKTLLGNVENPEEDEIESLCKLLSTVGALLDTQGARAHFMLQDVVELRDPKWNTRNIVAAPTTPAAVHDLANEDRAAAERESVQRMNSMSRTGSRRGGERGQYDQQGPDGWTVTGERGGRGTPCPPPKADVLSTFGKINKTAPMTFGPTSVFAKGKEGAKGPRTEPISRSSSSSNMFSMLSQNSEIARMRVALSPAPLQRRKLQLLPRPKMTEDGGDGTAASTPVSENGEVEESGTAADSMSEADAKKHLDQDSKEFFAVRNLDEAEEYFQKLTPEHRFRLADKLVNTAIESKAADAPLVSDFFAQAHSKDLCSEASFEEGFMPIAELLDDIAIDAPKAFDLMAVMVKDTGNIVIAPALTASAQVIRLLAI
ncbi:hypothetical protein FIBSPDRAFT_1051378 [Athelia psychrophila]|uniref:MI domain-containing protein n=1 Tax=Athelia psychrophila TaxID=1759441 RepID=A0A165ZA38_9AGAM|nr:hypothetical protein FIBSPDRAFT_1051378 [Fibularhizoctonia sp. CBS 109695]